MSETPPWRRPIKVHGVEVPPAGDDLGIVDLSTDMDRVAALMGFWGSVWASAVEEHAMADAHYRSWRARETQRLLDSSPKLAEWKLKADIEASPHFLALKQAIASAERNVVHAKATFESFSKKANQLQSKGAMLRDELGATGMHTPSEPAPPKPKPARRPVAAPPERLERPTKVKDPSKGDHRVSAVRDLFTKG